LFSPKRLKKFDSSDKMNLSKRDADYFYRLYFSLLSFVNEQCELFKDKKSAEDLRDMPIEQKIKLRDRLYADPVLIDIFIDVNPLNLSPGDLEIIHDWKDFVKGRFIVLRYLKNYTVFLDKKDPPFAYGVIGTYAPIKEILGKKLPIITDSVLLPFKGQIVADGMFSGYTVTIARGFRGVNFREDFEESYRETKFRTGIITSLPIPKLEEKTDEDRLRFYLKSKQNQNNYYQETEELINKNPGLLTLYHQETGKVFARSYRKKLRKVGIPEGWFAVLEGVIIAAGENKKNVMDTVDSIVPSEKTDFIYVFQFKKGLISMFVPSHAAYSIK
jgi:hypothetical protein